MNDLTKIAVERSIRDSYNPATGLLDAADFLLDEIYMVNGLKNTATRKQYFEMISKNLRGNHISKEMTAEQRLWRSKSIVMLKNMAESYNRGTAKEDLIASMQKHDRGWGIFPVLRPWVEVLYKCHPKPFPSNADSKAK